MKMQNIFKLLRVIAWKPSEDMQPFPVAGL